MVSESFFDTLTLQVKDIDAVRKKAEAAKINFRYFDDGKIGIALDETTAYEDLSDIINVVNLVEGSVAFDIQEEELLNNIPATLRRASEFMTHPTFNSYHSETLMMRYIKSLEQKDLSLNTSMISLGSCTMKLNAASEMIPLSWSHWSRIHPFAPEQQTQGYLEIVHDLEKYLCEITGFSACSLQPNSGASGEYAGLLAIRAYHESRGEAHRNIILLPISAHGTTPASAVRAG